MAVDKMLVAFDESEGSKKALKTASELAAAIRMPISILSMWCRFPC